MERDPTAVRAGRADQLSSGQSRVVEVHGRRVLLARCGDCIFACEAICPHRSNPLDGARISGFELECPWHHYRYDLRTGENIYPREVYPLGAKDIDQAGLLADLRPLRLYPVVVRNAEIFIELQSAEAGEAK